MARTIRGVGGQEESGGFSGSEPEAHELRLCGYLLPPQAGPGYADGRDDGCAGRDRKARKGALCGNKQCSLFMFSDIVMNYK